MTTDRAHAPRSASGPDIQCSSSHSISRRYRTQVDPEGPPSIDRTRKGRAISAPVCSPAGSMPPLPPTVTWPRTAQRPRRGRDASSARQPWEADRTRVQRPPGWTAAVRRSVGVRGRWTCGARRCAPGRRPWPCGPVLGATATCPPARRRPRARRRPSATSARGRPRSPRPRRPRIPAWSPCTGSTARSTTTPCATCWASTWRRRRTSRRTTTPVASTTTSSA